MQEVVKSSGHSVLASGMRVIHRFLTDRGVNADEWFTAHGMQPALLWDPRARIDAALGEHLLMALITDYPDPNLGLSLVGFSRFMDRHLVGVLAFASGNGLEALERLVRYQGLFNTAEPFSLYDDGRVVTFKRRVLMSPPAAFLVQTYFFALILRDLKEIGVTGGIDPEVSFTGPPPDEPTLFVETFGRGVRFNQTDAALSIPREVLLLPLTTANPDIIAVNEEMLGALVRAVKSEGLQASLKLKILDNLPDRLLSEEEASQLMNLSVRTLQRRLKTEGTSFKAVQQEARTQLATTMLSDPGLSITEIAFSCGFSEQASFSRAFRKWTDQSPSSFRSSITS